MLARSRLRLELLVVLRQLIMAPLVDGWDYGSWSAVYNALSFGIAGMGSATIFFWLQIYNVNKKYRTALTITGLVTFIATYHYFRIFNSWNDAFDVKFETKCGNLVLHYQKSSMKLAGRIVGLEFH